MASLMQTNCEYWGWLDHYTSHSDYLTATQRFYLHNADLLGMHTARTMVSIGAGDGRLDSFIIDNCTANLEHYIGVEPDQKSFTSLASALQKYNHLEVSLTQEAVPSWRGPARPVDLVLVAHPLYHIADRGAAVRQFYGWLRPGGSLVILHSSYDTTYGKIAQSLNIPIQRYTFDDVKHTLFREGLSCKEVGTITVTLDSACPLDDATLRSYFMNYVWGVTEEEMSKLVEAFRQDYPAGNGHRIQFVDKCMKVDKPIQ